MAQTAPVRVRIAPSPTGKLHVGTARTALYNYLFARRHGGTFILRLEDTDSVRSSEAFTQDILAGLKWLGLSWDEGPDCGGPYGPYRQTEKLERYRQIAADLMKSGHAYSCYCTQEELVTLRERQKASGEAPRYDNRCRNISAEIAAGHKRGGKTAAIRFKIEEPGEVTWHDAIRETVTIGSSDLGGDMVIVKTDGTATYNFAVVVDDIDMQITHVIRGEDHIHNTAKQLLVYKALAQSAPVLAHVSLMVDAQRCKLSKRQHGEAVHIDRYIDSGYLSRALVNYLAQMSWTHPDGREIFTLPEAAQLFDLSRVSRSAAVFDQDRLNWFNSQYIRTLPLKVITEACIPWLADYDLNAYSRPDLERIIAVVRARLTVLAEVKEATAYFFEAEVSVPQELRESYICHDSAQKVLRELYAGLSRMPWSDPQGCKAFVDTIGEQLKIKGKSLYWPIRAALSGRVQGPDIGEIISILGEAHLRPRIESALKLSLNR